MKKVANLQDKLVNIFKNNLFLTIIWVLVVFLSSIITITNGLTILHNYYKATVTEKKTYYKMLDTLVPGLQIDYFYNILGSPAIIKPNIENTKKERQVSCWVLRGNCPNMKVETKEGKIFIGMPFDKNQDFFKTTERLIRELLSQKHQIVVHVPAKTLANLCQMCKAIRSSSFCIIDTTYNDISMMFGLGLAFGRDKKFIQLHNTSLSSERPISDLRPWAIEYTNLAELKELLRNDLQIRLGDL